MLKRGEQSRTINMLDIAGCVRTLVDGEVITPVIYRRLDNPAGHQPPQLGIFGFTLSTISTRSISNEATLQEQVGWPYKRVSHTPGNIDPLFHSILSKSLRLSARVGPTFRSRTGLNSSRACLTSLQVRNQGGYFGADRDRYPCRKAEYVASVVPISRSRSLFSTSS
jgi:hypothetical protein